MGGDGSEPAGAVKSQSHSWVKLQGSNVWSRKLCSAAVSEGEYLPCTQMGGCCEPAGAPALVPQVGQAAGLNMSRYQ